ncbi:hypothetical protein HPB52_012183 [Rhipicephalus sanguineus]|uniref:Nlr family card domain protein n=1 Tax=Rhipicephalus sanguineus TaxID=34632 RepID=A0A9D4PMK2_RHISA|nr:hypothetical protein HPB52_012183 [Rhipicephalus sanguineus]
MPERKHEPSETCGRSRRNPSPALQDMASAKGCFSGRPIDYQRPCTSGEGRLCDIFRELPLWNEFFWYVCLELRELSPGQMSLVETYGAIVPCGMTEQKQQAATLLYHLLTLHRCIVSVKLNAHIVEAHDKLICDALRQSSSLIKLDMNGCGCVDKTASYRLIAVLPHMTQLRELELGMLNFGYASSERFSEFLASTRSLRTLIMTGEFFKWDHALQVARGLKQNVTITTLSLNTSAVDNFWSSREEISAYLHEASTLRALSVTAHCRLKNKACEIVEPMFLNNTISELNLTDFHINTGDTQLIPALLIQNRTLRSLNFVNCAYKPAPQYDADTCVIYTESFGYVSSRIYPWVVALNKNNTLEELTLSLSWYDADEWRSFFKALASNASLQKINVSQFPREDVTEIFRAMRETGVQERFFVGAHHVFEDTVVALTECKQLSCIEVDSTIFLRFEPLLTAPCLIQSCSHMTSLCMVFEKQLSTVTVSSLIAQCITGAMALRALHLTFRNNCPIWLADRRIQRALVQAVSVNRTIRSLHIWGLRFDETETQMLVETLRSSRTLYDFYFHPHDDESTFSFVRKLSPILSSNYTLLGLHLTKCVDLGGEFFTMAEVVRRNNSLVTRATHFVMGTKSHKYCAEALELVHSTPGLVARLQNSTSADENQAVVRIWKSLKNFSELDEFMRVTGVVKDRVTCHPRDDGKMQLADLNRDCWLYIRRYLMVSDIRDVQ